MEEIHSGEDYENRKDLGNIYPGDGRRFKGRGPIQLTGRNNYRRAGEALGIDLENYPEKAAEPTIGFQIAVWFWNDKKINIPADKLDFKRVTLLVNGGYNGLAHREKYYKTACEVLNVR
jgi:putative chitinase